MHAEPLAQSTSRVERLRTWIDSWSCRVDLNTVAARKLEYDHPPTSKLGEEGTSKKSSQAHVPTFWSLL